MTEIKVPPDLLERVAEFDVNDLDIGESLVIEEAFGGQRLDTIPAADWETTKGLLYLAWALMRRNGHPDFTVEQAKRIKWSELLAPGEGDADPTPGAKAPAKRTGSAKGSRAGRSRQRAKSGTRS